MSEIITDLTQPKRKSQCSMKSKRKRQRKTIKKLDFQSIQLQIKGFNQKETWVIAESHRTLSANDVESLIFQPLAGPFAFFRKLVANNEVTTKIRKDPQKMLSKSILNFVKHHTDVKERPSKSRRKASKDFWAKGTGYGGANNKVVGASLSGIKRVNQKNTKALILLDAVNNALKDFASKCCPDKTYSYATNIRLIRLLCIKTEMKQKVRGKDEHRIVRYDSFMKVLIALLRNNSIIEISQRISFYNSLLSLVKEILGVVTIRFLLFLPFPGEFTRKETTIFSLVKDLAATLDNSFCNNLDAQDVSFIQTVKSLTSSMEKVYVALNIEKLMDDFSLSVEPEVDGTGIALIGSKVSIDLETLLENMPKALSRKDRRKIIRQALKLTDMDEQSILLRERAYCRIMSALCFKAVDIKLLAQNGKVDYAFLSQATQSAFYDKKRMLRIARELTSLAKSLPLSYSSSIVVRVDETQNDILSFLIIGPKNTPYEHGVFIFDCYFNSFYPNEPPKVVLKTTGHGSVRFNPNLYANGKVCLSLLGTWTGPSWSPTSSTFLQVLVSIQSLIFVDDPFFNEPGYESQIGTPAGKAMSKKYNSEIVRNNLRFAIYESLTSPSLLFKDVILAHFTLKARDIEDTMENWGWKYSCSHQAKYMLAIRKKLAILSPVEKPAQNIDAEVISVDVCSSNSKDPIVILTGEEEPEIIVI